MTAGGKALLVSAWQPGKPGAMQGGLYRRLSIMIDAIRQNCDTLDALFYLRHLDDCPEKEEVRAIERNLSDCWNIDVHASFCHRDDPEETEHFIDRYLRPVSGFFRLPGYSGFTGTAQVAALNRCLARRPRFIFTHRLQCMVPLLLTKLTLPPVFFDLDDVEHVAMLRGIAQPPHWWSKNLAYLQLPALLWGERRALKLARSTFVCSRLDQDKLARLFRVKNVEVVHNAVPMPLVSEPSKDPCIVMLGTYDYAPNRLGAEYFLEHVWPVILSVFPPAEVIFAGPRPETIRHFTNPPRGVIFAGYVEDLNELYRVARLVVCPILSGGGTRVKIIEAAAYGRPIVSTTLGAEGIDLSDGTEIVLRDSASSFANACVTLLKDDVIARTIGQAGRLAVESRYNRPTIVAELANIISESLKSA